MNEKPTNSEDAAWVTIDTPMPRDWMNAFINDIERIFRINSLMEFSHWIQIKPDLHQITGKNLSNGKPFDTKIAIEKTTRGIKIVYWEGLKTSTRIELDEDGKTLTIRDDYSAAPASERKNRLDEVDKSLIQWGHDIHRYLKQWKRYAFLPGYHWYMRRVWQPMKPSTRRICAMLIMVTAAEFILFLAVFTIFWLELDRFIG